MYIEKPDSRSRYRILPAMVRYLVQTTRWRHGSLDRQAANVLPAFLEQGDEIIDGQHDVANELILRHSNIAHGHSHAQHLLQLEFDGRLDLGHL